MLKNDGPKQTSSILPIVFFISKFMDHGRQFEALKFILKKRIYKYIYIMYIAIYRVTHEG